MSTCTNQKIAAPSRHYFLREDFDHLMDPPLPEDVYFPGERDSSSSLAYPKSVKGAYLELRLRGLQCGDAVLSRLVSLGIVKGDGENWEKQDIDAAAEWLYENEFWTSWTHFCWMHNLRFGQCVKAQRAASAKYGLGYSQSFDPIGLVSVVEPAQEGDDYGFIRFFPKGTRLEPSEASR